MVPKLLIAFGSGCLVGSPIGIIIINRLDLTWIKAIAAITILLITLWNAYLYLMPIILKPDFFSNQGKGKRSVQIGVGVASGILGSTLAMPAPFVMLYLSATSYKSQQIRATLLVYFILAYGMALSCQLITQDVQTETWITAAGLCPAALIGVFVGNKLAPTVNYFYFRVIVFSTLSITSLIMLINVSNIWVS